MSALAIITGASKGLGRAVSYSFFLSFFTLFPLMRYDKGFFILFSFLIYTINTTIRIRRLDFTNMAVEAAKSLSLSRLVLVSRSKEGLEETNKHVLSSHPSLHSSIHSLDFSDLDHLENNLKALFKEVLLFLSFFYLKFLLSPILLLSFAFFLLLTSTSSWILASSSTSISSQTTAQ